MRVSTFSLVSTRYENFDRFADELEFKITLMFAGYAEALIKTAIEFACKWFGTYPEIWSMFSTTAKNVDDLLESPSIMNHSKKFEELFEIVIYNLHKREKLVESLIEYGKFHHSFGAQQRFATTLATGLKFAVFSYLQNDHNQDDCKTQEAWDSLFSFLSGLLKLGMRKAIEEEKADGRDPKQSTSQKTIFEEFSV
ncbi:uncharacterized protein LOC130648128 [Hydractinia symbiolongicarpus]|uniref:uncharacterized protein LOC130648128 n=1 Tax=Hydractinia symbiolongicarpus TaxID=13093 RepID=UPI00254CCEE0|nr:uncharacterized protein LOC130648128 [Hydractinia symbiolongicarpus]